MGNQNYSIPLSLATHSKNWWSEQGATSYTGRQMITSLGRDTTQVFTDDGAGDRNLISNSSPTRAASSADLNTIVPGSASYNTESTPSPELVRSNSFQTTSVPAAPFTWRWLENSNGYSTSNTLSSLNPAGNMAYNSSYMYRTIGSDSNGSNSRVLDVMENQAANTNVFNGTSFTYRLFNYNPATSGSETFPASGSINPFGRVATNGSTIFTESTPLIYNPAGTGDFSSDVALTDKRGAVNEMTDSDLYLQVFDPDYSGDELAMPSSNQRICTNSKSEVTTAGEFNGTGNYIGENANVCSTEWFTSYTSWQRSAMWRGGFWKSDGCC